MNTGDRIAIDGPTVRGVDATSGSRTPLLLLVADRCAAHDAEAQGGLMGRVTLEALRKWFECRNEGRGTRMSGRGVEPA